MKKFIVKKETPIWKNKVKVKNCFKGLDIVDLTITGVISKVEYFIFNRFYFKFYRMYTSIPYIKMPLNESEVHTNYRLQEASDKLILKMKKTKYNLKHGIEK